MLFIACAVLLISLALLVLGWRGRVSGRGVYCRSCRFDLGGIDISLDDARCPECGRSISSTHAPRSVVRSKCRPMIVSGCVVFLLGAGLAAMSVGSNAAKIYGVMPDRLVLSATEWGSSDALDELLTRLGSQEGANPWVWDAAIEQALALQEETSRAWDPRWGEVIALAWQGQHLSDEQMIRFAVNGAPIQVWLRDRIRIGDAYVSYLIEQRNTRASGLNRMQTGFMLSISTLQSGIITDGVEIPNRYGGGGSSSSSFAISRFGSSGSSSSGSGVMIPSPQREQLRSGDEFTVYMDVQLTLRSQTDDYEIKAEPVRFEQRVRVVGEDEPIVRVIDDPLAAKQVREGLSIEPFIGLTLDSIDRYQGQEHVSSQLTFTAKPRAVAGKLYFRHHIDGELFEAGSFSTTAHVIDLNQTPVPQISHMHQVQVRIDQDDPERMEAFERITRDGVVDVILRTDPSAAESNARLTEIVDMECEFVGVPVLIVGTNAERYSARPEAMKIIATESAEE
jgi:hypothetical protein